MYYIQAEFKGKTIKADTNLYRSFNNVGDIKQYLANISKQHNVRDFLIFLGTKTDKKH